jgi:hypothetical protein
MRMKPYRLEIPLSRELSAKLEELKRDAEVKTGKRASKSDLAARILARFFETADSLPTQEASCSSSKK